MNSWHKIISEEFLRLLTHWSLSYYSTSTVYPGKCAHDFVVLCFVVVMQSFIMNSHEVFIHIHQGCYLHPMKDIVLTDIGAYKLRLPAPFAMSQTGCVTVPGREAAFLVARHFLTARDLIFQSKTWNICYCAMQSVTKCILISVGKYIVEQMMHPLAF